MLLIDEVLFYTSIAFGVVGLLITGFVLTLIIRKKSLRQEDYMIFVIHRIFVDGSLSLLFCTLQLAGIKFWITDPIWCKVAGGLLNAVAMALFCLEAMLAFNRYVSICHRNSYERIFKRRNIHSMCATMWLFGILITVPNIVGDTLGRIPGFYCNVKLEKQYLLIIGLADYSTVIVTYIIVAFCYCKIFLALKRHQAQINDSGLESRLQEDKSILRYIRSAALLPLITESPICIANAVRLYDAVIVPDFVIFYSGISFLFCPTINPALTLLMIRPVRKEFFNVLKRLSSDNVSQVAPISIQVQPSGPSHFAHASSSCQNTRTEPWRLATA